MSQVKIFLVPTATQNTNTRITACPKLSMPTSLSLSLSSSSNPKKRKPKKAKTHLSLFLQKLSEIDGSAVGSGVSRPDHTLGFGFISLRAVAYLSGDFHRTHSRLSYLRRLRLLPVLPFSLTIDFVPVLFLLNSFV